jgi:hypothetical protein
MVSPDCPFSNLTGEWSQQKADFFDSIGQKLTGLDDRFAPKAAARREENSPQNTPSRIKIGTRITTVPTIST